MILRATIVRLRALNKGFTLVRSRQSGPDQPERGYWLVPMGVSEPVSEDAMTLDEVREYLRTCDDAEGDGA
jgi:hypothetical protein